MSLSPGRLVALFIVCLAVSLPGGAPAGEHPVIIGTQHGIEPWAGQSLEHYGFLSRVVNQALLAGQRESEFRFLPWKRVLHMLSSGEVDIAFPMVRTSDRAEKFLMTDLIVTSSRAIFFLKGRNFDWQSLKSFEGLNVGAVGGYRYGPDFEAAEKEGRFHVERLDTQKQILMMLLKGRVDIGIIDIDLAHYLIRRDFYQHRDLLTHHPRFYGTLKYYAMINRAREGSGQLLADFNRGLERIKIDGRYDAYFREFREWLKSPPDRTD